ncbi:MAG: hypothetical protein KatS3mg131_0833 [Candidatus Tectimicrobiota bacterium]|nr:MAG: hypothetical protein KatS3mg131_0833 [Candidatus Tectomicrobia bacterium]
MAWVTLSLEQCQAWIALHLACTTWPSLATQWARQLALPGMAERLLTEGLAALEAALPDLQARVQAVQRGQAFARYMQRLATEPVQVIPFVDARYPRPLRWIPDPPPVLYVRGTLVPEDELAVAVVGTRKPSAYGRLQAQRLSAELVRCGLTVISGMARGIDSLAHASALEAGGRTLAVLGSGINVVYPPENRRLYTAISEQGAVLSEFPLDTKPDRWNFPRRNRLISGLSLGVLVVEATTTSGSLHTARHALEQGREVFAVPGRVDSPSSRGTHGLIKHGAKLVEDVEDILAEFPEAVRQALAQRQPAPAGPPPRRLLHRR